MRSLMDEAKRLGVRVHTGHLPREISGYYDHEGKRIAVDITLTPQERREVLAHELGHAFHGHSCGSAAHEAQADRRAAALLIDPAEYAAAEQEHPAVGAIAERLEIDPHYVHVWRRHWLPRIEGALFA